MPPTSICFDWIPCLPSTPCALGFGRFWKVSASMPTLSSATAWEKCLQLSNSCCCQHWVRIPVVSLIFFSHPCMAVFRNHPDATATFQTKQFALLTSNAVFKFYAGKGYTNWTRTGLGSKRCRDFRGNVVERKQIHGRNADRFVNMDKPHI